MSILKNAAFSPARRICPIDCALPGLVHRFSLNIANRILIGIWKPRFLKRYLRGLVDIRRNYSGDDVPMAGKTLVPPSVKLFPRMAVRRRPSILTPFQNDVQEFIDFPILSIDGENIPDDSEIDPLYRPCRNGAVEVRETNSIYINGDLSFRQISAYRRKLNLT